MDNLQGGEIHLCAEGLRHCGICSALKFHEFATKPDRVALMPTSHGHDCEDDECVDGSAISPATVYVAGLNAPIGIFSSTHAQLFVFILRDHCSIDRYTWNQSVLSVVPWLL